jgi:hypothetical protein
LGDYSLTCKSVTLDGNDLQGLLGAKVPYTGATGNVNLGGYSLLADGLGANYFGIETYGMYQVGSIYNPEEEGFAVTIRSGGSRPYNAITTDGFYARRFVGLSYGSDTKPYIALDDGYKIGENRMFYVNPLVTEGDVFYLKGRNGSFNISNDIALSITKDSVAYEIWSAYNDGRDSGLDADLLDGNHALDFEPALSKGNLSESTSSVLTITGGTNSVIGSGTTIQVKQASALQDGYLAKEDFATFNSCSIVQNTTMSYSGLLVANTGKLRWNPPSDIVILGIKSSVNTPSSGADIITELKKNGNSFDTPRTSTITQGQYVSVKSTFTETISETDYLTLDIIQVGNSFSGSDLTFTIYYRKG